MISTVLQQLQPIQFVTWWSRVQCIWWSWPFSVPRCHQNTRKYDYTIRLWCLVAFYPTDCFHSHNGYGMKPKKGIKYTIGISVTIKPSSDPRFLVRRDETFKLQCARLQCYEGLPLDKTLCTWILIFSFSDLFRSGIQYVAFWNMDEDSDGEIDATFAFIVVMKQRKHETTWASDGLDF